MQPVLRHILHVRHKIQAVFVSTTTSAKVSYVIWESVLVQQLIQLANTIQTVLKGCIVSMTGNTKVVSILTEPRTLIMAILS